MTLSRRQVLTAGASIIGVAGTPAISFGACERTLTPTASIGSIPEYIPGAPTRTSFLQPGMTGQRVRLFGKALTTTCEALVSARLNFWHTDSSGTYDAVGYNFRGSQQTDRGGRFLLETVMPGQYNGPRHIHFLLATRLRGRPQPFLLSGVVYFPTAEEFAQAPASDRTAEFLSPHALATVDGVLMAPCNIILEVV
jgi:protocatechuate 3,4-dioxygenase beta subunit